MKLGRMKVQPMKVLRSRRRRPGGCPPGRFLPVLLLVLPAGGTAVVTTASPRLLGCGPVPTDPWSAGTGGGRRLPEHLGGGPLLCLVDTVRGRNAAGHDRRVRVLQDVL